MYMGLGPWLAGQDGKLMADYQRVVEFLRDVRSMQNPPVNDDLRQHAQEFADLCTQVNERLRKCSSLLQQGLRSEAIHLAEESPNLLDLVTALDLPDPQVWVEFCQATELPVPPPLQLDRAAQLNEAYAIDQPMEHLLGQHRLLALQRAPVGKRLTVMRQLASQDPGSSFWEKDIRLFERVRLRELPGEFYEAVRRRDDTSVMSLVEEIEGQPWYETVPEDLRTAINEANARIHRTHLETDLRRQLDGLHEAFSSRNLEQSTALLAKWNQTIKLAGAPNITKDIVEQVAPIAAWIEQEAQAAARLKAYNSSIATFTQLLDQDSSDAELDGALDRVKAFDEHPVPENLVERLRAMRARRNQAARSKQKMRLTILATSAAVVLLVASVALFMIMRNRSAVGWANRINSTVSSGQIEQIKKVLADQERDAPQFTNDPQVSAARQTALNYVHAYADRAQTVATAIVTLTELKTTYSKVLGDNQLKATDLLGQAGTLEQRLAALPGDEVNDADPTSAMRSLKAEVSGIYAQIRDKASGQVREQLAVLDQMLMALPDGGLTPEQAGTLQKIQSDAALLRDTPGLSEAVKAVAVELVAAAEAKGTGNEKAVAQATDLAGLLEKTASPEGYKSALDAFVGNYPDARQTPDFKLASAQLDGIKPMLAWRDVLTGLGGAGALAPKLQAQAQKRAEAVQAFLDANKDSPLKTQIQAYEDYLKAAGDALADDGTVHKALGELLANPLISQLQYLTDSTGKKHYFLTDTPTITKGSVGTRTTTQFEEIDPTNPLRKRAVTLEDPVRLTNQKTTPAPHVALAEEINKQLANLNKTNWDTIGFELVDLIGGDSDDVDPIVKAALLQAVITALKQTTAAAVGDTYDETLQSLTRFLGQFGSSPSLTTTLPGAAVAQWQVIMKAMPKGKVLEAAYVASRQQLFADLSFVSDTTGMIVKTTGGLVILPRTDPSEGMIAKAPGLKGMTVAGKFTDGKWVLTPDANDLPEGSWLSISK
jgi:hypothetical protein